MGQQDSPKANEDKYAKVEDAWSEQASETTFGGMTLTQFQTRIKPSKDARKTVKDLEDALAVAQTRRDIADLDTMVAVDLVVKGVIGDPNFGDNCPLYSAMGYIRKSERKSGLTRKKKKSGANNGDAASG